MGESGLYTRKMQYRIKLWCGIAGMFFLFSILGIPVYPGGAGISREAAALEGSGASVEAKAPEEESTSGEADSVDSRKMTEPPKLAITFDDGPNASCTGRLLDGLRKRGVKATFFLIGKYAKENPELVKRIYEEGHLIGNHTYDHVDITTLSDEEAAYEINETDEVICSITGEHVRYVRPPFGAWRKDLELKMDALPVMWTVDPLDWTTENVEEIVNKVVADVEENDIILLHDCYDSSVDAALRIIDILTGEGYEFVTVEELI